MGHIIGKRKRPLNRKANSKPVAENHVTLTHPPVNLASVIRGLYRRVARQMHVDPSYVSRVARGERRSKIIQDALRRELIRILEEIKKTRKARALRTPRRKSSKIE
jgi:hypothetical protein